MVFVTIVVLHDGVHSSFLQSERVFRGVRVCLWNSSSTLFL